MKTIASKPLYTALLTDETLISLVQLAIEQLQPNDAKALELFYFFEQSLEEIGALTGWSANSIKTRLFRARHRLHSLLQNEGLGADHFA